MKTMNTTIDRPLADGTNTSFAYLNSTCLESVAYNVVLQQLFVTFREGNTYRYFDVPSEDYVELQQAISAGLYFNDNIKGIYKCELFC